MTMQMGKKTMMLHQLCFPNDLENYVEHDAVLHQPRKYQLLNSHPLNQPATRIRKA